MIIPDFDIIMPYRLGMKFRSTKQGKKQHHIGWISYRRRAWDGKVPDTILNCSIGKDYDEVMQKVRPYFKTYQSYHHFYHSNLGTDLRRGHHYGLYKDENGLIQKYRQKARKRPNKATLKRNRKRIRKMKKDRKIKEQKTNDVLQLLMNNKLVLSYYSKCVKAIRTLDYDFNWRYNHLINKGVHKNNRSKRSENRFYLRMKRETREKIKSLQNILQDIENGNYTHAYRNTVPYYSF